MKEVLLSCLAVVCLASSANAQVTIKSADINFHTTSDDKDGDSQVRDRVVCNGQDFLTLFCCSSGRKGPDHWDNGSDNTRPMNVVSQLDRNSLGNCTFVAGLTANGNDTWVAIYTIVFTLSDNTKVQYTLGEIWLDSEHGQYIEKQVQLSKLTPTFP